MLVQFFMAQSTRTVDSPILDDSESEVYFVFDTSPWRNVEVVFASGHWRRHPNGVWVQFLTGESVVLFVDSNTRETLQRIRIDVRSQEGDVQLIRAYMGGRVESQVLHFFGGVAVVPSSMTVLQPSEEEDEPVVPDEVLDLERHARLAQTILETDTYYDSQLADLLMEVAGLLRPEPPFRAAPGSELARREEEEVGPRKSIYDFMGEEA